MMPLILRLAWRETRAGFRHLVVLVVCVALGVTALVAVTGLAGNIDRALAREGKSLVGGHVELPSPLPPDAESQAALADFVARGATIPPTRALAPRARHSARRPTPLVQLKAVPQRYPP